MEVEYIIISSRRVGKIFSACNQVSIIFGPIKSLYCISKYQVYQPNLQETENYIGLLAHFQKNPKLQMKDNKIIWSSSSNSKCPEQFLWLLLVIFMIESGAVIATPDLGSNQLFWRGILNCIMLSPLQINSFQEHKALNKWGENSFFSLSLFRHLNMTMCHGFLG